ncbi:unnamed protein product [Plutella xylostella]|uniref:Tubulin-specific chaperone D n=1 Tax=Plutella xylostella TaxID=51655 RepID=A0A8S4G569_PLUXY|nr:unnamed protein product [Plutella xylostella]
MVGLVAEHLDEDCDNIGLGCALEHFAEVDEVLDMIDNLKNIYDKPEIELQYDKLYNILKQYYEQPHLLDPHLEKILSKFLVLIKEADSPMQLKDAVFNYMYQIVRVRGYKVVVRHLPHEVSDLLMVLSMLEAHDDEDKECWRSRFVLLLWLSIVVIIPFHMSRLDGFAPGAQDDASTKQLTVMERIFNICKKYALSRDTCAEASAYLASKFFIRGDVKEVYLGPFFEWACNLQTSVTGESTIHYGVLAAVAAVLKHGKRDDLLPYAPKLLEWVAKLNFRQSNAMLVRKYGVKIVQRIGLTYLRARAASWRYTVGARSLSGALRPHASGDTAPAAPDAAQPVPTQLTSLRPTCARSLSGALRPHASGDTAPAAPDAAQPVPTQVEDVVELLLCSLRDDDTVVRWSAAKGLGRIGARLSAEAAADVAESVLTLFDAGERDLACHGGCMAIAELARRGLLSPEQLGASITSVCAALARDEPRCGGTRAARDAACHAAWAFARAYSPEALKPYAGEVANGLIATACFDREINVRRAASAAYQENVGRHGLFPRGIFILFIMHRRAYLSHHTRHSSHRSMCVARRRRRIKRTWGGTGYSRAASIFYYYLPCIDVHIHFITHYTPTDQRASRGVGGVSRERGAARAVPARHLYFIYHASTCISISSHTTLVPQINVRRAASAAYQENVGRHGLFPRGIDVLTAADFQAVGPRAHAYLEVAPYVASFPEYTIPLIDHLVDLKTEHWDCAIRELSAKALHKLTHKAPEYVATTVLPKLVAKTQSIDLNVRHGAILALGEAIHALAEAELPDGTRADSLIPPSVLTSVHGLVSGLRARRQLLGLGGELVRAATCQCVAALSRARVPLPAAAVQDWIQLLEECLEHEVSSIRDHAVAAIPCVFTQYLQPDDLEYEGGTAKLLQECLEHEVSSIRAHAVAAMPCVFTQYLQPDDLEYEGGTAKEKRVQLLEKYCEQLSNTGVNGLLLRMGYAKAIGSLPKFVLSDSCAHVIRSLIECTKVSPPTAKWAEARRDAALALSAVLQTTDRLDLAPEVIAALLEALDEYTVDMRGDIGAWVREASMTGLLSVCRQCAVSAPEVLTPDVVSGIMTRLAQQAVEKIDRTRALAGRIFTAFIYNDPVIPNIPHHEELKEIFPPEDVELKPLVQKPDTDETPAPSTQYNNTVLWLFPGHTMPRFTRLLACETYRPRLLLGLAVSGGERSDTLVKHTTQSLFAFLRSADLPLLQEICRELTAIFTRHLHDRRVSQPMFNLLERLLSSGAISPILDDPASTFAADVLKYVQLELRGGKHWYKLLDSINVLCQLVQVGGEVCRKSLGQLVIYLCYSECYVRRCAAARLYEALALYGDVSCVPASNQDQVCRHISHSCCSSQARQEIQTCFTLVSYSEPRQERKSLGQLVIYLCYSECYVRRCAAARLYEALALYGDVSCVPASSQDQVMEVLAETDWERDVTELRPIRNELCDLMGIKRPLLKQKPAAAAAP